MIRVLFISLNNKYRAPSARAIFSKIVGDQKLENRFFIDSSSILQDNTNSPLDEILTSVTNSKGYDLSDYTNHNMRLEKLSAFDYIITFDSDDYKAILKLTNPAIHSKINKLASYSHDHSYKEIKHPKEDKESILFMINVLENNLQDLFYHIKIDRKIH